jgi:hypothetical protein
VARRQLPTKPSGDAAVEAIRGKGPTKGKTPPRVTQAKGRKAKPRVDAKTKRAALAPAPVEAGGWPELGDQQAARRGGKAAERYLRLHVRIDDGQAAIVGSHVVEGPLAQTPTFEGGYAYEVTTGERLLHAGSIPDFGVFRSFAHPNGTLEQRRHHSYELPVHEFHARVPMSELDRSTLPKVAVVLYRVKEHPAPRAALGQAMSAAPLAVQKERELREVARVEGLPSWVLGAGRAAPAPSAARAPASTGYKRRTRKK